MYAAPVWASSALRAQSKEALRRAQRSALVRTTTAYRTVAYLTLCVMAGRMPVLLKVEMGRQLWEAKARDRRDLALTEVQRKERAKAHKKEALEAAASR